MNCVFFPSPRLFIIFIFLILTLVQKSSAQDTSFSYGGYIDAYYSYDDDKDGNLLRKFSSTSPNREEFRLNIAQIYGGYQTKRIRAYLALHYGDMPSVNWPVDQQYIQQAYAGFSPSRNLWIDAGYLLTHIGAEASLPKDNYLTIQSVPTYFEPFFQSGIRFSYDFSRKFSGAIHLLNGFNVFADNNKNKSFGLTLDYHPDSLTDIGFNNIAGNEQPSGSEPKFRIYNNFIFKFPIGKKLEFLSGFDFAAQENSSITDSTAYGFLFSGFAEMKYKFAKKFSAAFRGEFFKDPDGFLSGIFINSDGRKTGLKIFGLTLGLEYKPADKGYVRVSARYLQADARQKIFESQSISRIESVIDVGLLY